MNNNFMVHSDTYITLRRSQLTRLSSKALKNITLQRSQLTRLSSKALKNITLQRSQVTRLSSKALKNITFQRSQLTRLSSKALKNSKLSCCSRKFTGSPQYLNASQKPSGV